MRWNVLGVGGCCVGLLMGASSVLAADQNSSLSSQSTYLAANATGAAGGANSSLDAALKDKSAKERSAITSLDAALYESKTFTANFHQEVYNDKGESLARSSGNLSLQRPDKFVMYTLIPDKVVLYLKDGDIYYYDELVSQVTIYSMSKLKDNPFLLLIEHNNQVWGDFTVTQDDDRYTLVPQQAQDIRSLTLSFIKNTKNPELGAQLLESITIRMNDGSTNFYRFSEHKLDVDPNDFNVKLPSNVEYNDERI